ncbi:MAG: selenium cofactor biosynthesis protein YqeC [Thermodesulfobacteriota bacterium]
MKQKTEGLTAVLNLGAREHIAIVGGGGKTMLGLRLAEEMRAGRKKVVSTTTTKVWYEEGNRFPHLVLCPPGADLFEAIGKSLEEAGHLFLAREGLNSGKLGGISPKEADLVFNGLQLDHVIVEADGAAGLPLKAPAGHEPVIPSSTTLVIAVMGLEPLGQPVDPKTIFRFTEFAQITGLKKGQQMGTAALAKLFLAPEGLYRGAPESARRIVFMNKSDLCGDLTVAEHLASLLVNHSTGGVDRVVAGSLHKEIYTRIG